MFTNTLHKKWIARFFVLIYLMLSASTGNASFWCQRAESASHLESNPVGGCWGVCHPEEEGLSSDNDASNSGFTVSKIVDDCFDSPAYYLALTHSTQTGPKSKVDVSEIGSNRLTYVPTNSAGCDRFYALIRAAQLLPHQALTALRTVVLLN